MPRIRFSAHAGQAKALDGDDELAEFRRKFHLPRAGSGPLIYLCGHSLGLMPRTAAAKVEREMRRWRDEAVDGHFSKGGWFGFHERFAAPLARLAGAHRGEVVAMNSLTVNLHLMLVSFYRPTKKRFRILVERGAFPSDRYAIQSQIRFHGFEPASAMIDFDPDDSGRLSPDSLELLLERWGDSIALALLPGVQFLSGEALDISGLTSVARKFGCVVGFDLAHAIGNVPLALHDSDVDFAVWCSYKYLNGGPGAIGGCFVHERHGQDSDLPRFAGWWGHDKSKRFLMEAEFRMLSGAEGWQLSNPPIMAMAALEASLDIFREARLARLLKKSRRLTGYLDELLKAHLTDSVEILTPKAADARGAQLSLRLGSGQPGAKAIAAKLRAQQIVVDVREPDILRVAPVPLYNRFRDVYEFVRVLRSLL